MVDILLAVYNGEKYLSEQINSIFAQTVRDFHIYARDDGSTDQSRAILKQHQAAHPEQMTLILNEAPTGSAKGNFFRLLNFSGGEHTMFCDQDDVWEKDKLFLSLKTMEAAGSDLGDVPLLVHSDLKVVDQSLRTVHPSMFRMQKLNPEFLSLNRLVAQNNITGCTVLINRKLKELVRVSEGALMHDWWVGLIAAAFGQIVFLPYPSVLYRQHESNEVGAKDVCKTEYLQKKLKNTGGIRASISDTYSQAQAFLSTYEDILSERQKELLKAYLQLHGYGVVKRFFALGANRFYKSGIYRKIGQIIYG